jgi:hypothetical protein
VHCVVTTHHASHVDIDQAGSDQAVPISNQSITTLQAAADAG